MKFPFNNTPLKSFPYNSRVSTNEFNTLLPSKNYVFVAFTPGSALQASELNEIQETFYKNTTLYNILFKNWLLVNGMTSGNTGPVSGPSWIGAVPLDPINSVSVISNNITFKKDWYLVDDGSGLKFWIYNNTEISIAGIADGYYGVNIESGYVLGTTSDLNDNSGGYAGSYISGADRYQINIIGATYSSVEGALTSNYRPILKKSGITYNYINNLLKS